MAGAIIATRRTYIDPGIAFNLNTSFLPVLMALFGGMGSLVGPVIGAALFTYIGELLLTRFPDLYMLIFGVVLILAIVFMPNGILGVAQEALEQDERRSTCTCLKVKESLGISAALPRSPTSTSTWTKERYWDSSGPTALARPLCSTSSRLRSNRRRGRSCSKGGRSPVYPLTRSAGWAGPDLPDGQDLPARAVSCRNVMVGSLFGTGRHERGRGPARRQRKRSSSWISPTSRICRPATSLWPTRSVSRWPGLWRRIPQCFCSTS